MFQRRKPLTFLQNIRQLIWPKMGWWRVAKYYRHRIVRLSSTAESIAVNMAAGSAMSFTPFFGLHIFGAMGFAWLIGARVSIIAATVGTLAGNPWTFPFLLYSSHWVGIQVLDILGADGVDIGVTPDVMEQQGENLVTYFLDNFAGVFVPTAIGGVILAVASFPVYYLIYRSLVRSAQRARKLRLRKQQRALFNRKAHGESEPES